MYVLGGRTVESLEAAGAPVEETVAQGALSSKRAEELAEAVKNDPQKTALLLDLVCVDGVRGKTEKELTAKGVSLVRTAATALAEISKDGTRAALTLPQLASLEAIVRLTGRPSMLIQQGDFNGPLDKSWEHLALDLNRNKIKRTLQSVGRVYFGSKGGNGRGIGTAWVAGSGVLVTNRHVVDPHLGKKSGDGWNLHEGTRVWVDFLVEEQNAKTLEFEVKRILHVEDGAAGHPDLALLEVETRNAAGETLPAPLPIASNDAEVRTSDDHVYTIGYPGFDDTHESEVLEQIFGGIYGRKRLAPGVITALDASTCSLQHDCSTLKGSSGSCVVRLATNKVVGLHFRGTQLSQNEAVLMAKMIAEARFKEFGLHFVP
ncbi:trypsin-like peptidase domain-containing protein [Corallococcus exiguus]|uniref:trypsin-like serine peptidase n=1 Tax=Corallococcus exiguus TaxID=83462 RepID=UPI001A8D5955|nr:serine protease [Corallococcus exiguus]MBN8471199.1 trypsin-like peptidase domain-containing protein [Corallococcus exiguus]